MKIIKIQEKVQIKEFILFFAMSCFCTFTVQSTYMSFGSGSGFVHISPYNLNGKISKMFTGHQENVFSKKLCSQCTVILL